MPNVGRVWAPSEGVAAPAGRQYPITGLDLRWHILAIFVGCARTDTVASGRGLLVADVGREMPDAVFMRV